MIKKSKGRGVSWVPFLTLLQNKSSMSIILPLGSPRKFLDQSSGEGVLLDEHAVESGGSCGPCPVEFRRRSGPDGWGSGVKVPNATRRGYEMAMSQFPWLRDNLNARFPGEVLRIWEKFPGNTHSH